jgi:hypothetical protein
MGNHDLACADFDKAIAIDAQLSNQVGLGYYCENRFDRAIATVVKLAHTA